MPSPLKTLYDQTPVGICIVRRDRRHMDILYTNPAMQHMLRARDDLAGRLLEDAWPHEDIDQLVRKLKANIPPTDYTIGVRHVDAQSQRWAKLTIQESVFDGAEAFIMWATDISTSKEAEARLEKAVAEADASATMKSNFLATMSHEIRTPMQTVFGLLELISEEKPEPRITDMVDTAKQSAAGMLEILDDILDLAKMDADKMELDTFEVPVRTLVRGINEAMAVKIHGQHVELRDDIAADVPFVIIGDPKRLRQVIMNLTGNALKFTQTGSVTIRVQLGGSTLPAPQNRIVLRFEIIDTGMGMAPEVSDTLFQPFTQADNSTSRKFGGTGLGLSICKKLVELMGGVIGVDSTPGAGSTFWFEIPTEAVSTDSNTVDLPKLDGISVLSVEDHPQGAQEIVRSLESMGATVESCPTYQEALALLKRRPFDVGIIDQGLPDGLGLDLIREALHIRPFMGLVMYTVRNDIGLQHSLNALGVTYLSKPASRRGLGEAVQDAAHKLARVNITGPRRLLIAEDTASVRDVLRRQLARLNVEADFVENGEQALQALTGGAYGILLTDLHMPHVDGYEVARQIRAGEDGTDTHFPVIVLTADIQMTQRQTYLSHGFDECLLKPVSLGQLKRLLIRWGLVSEEDDRTAPAEAHDAAAATQAGPDLPPAVDIELVKTQMGAFDASTIEMLHLFIEMTVPTMEKLQDALTHQDYESLHEIAHSLKGAARSACCNVLGDLAADLQDEAAHSGPRCPSLVHALHTEFARVSTTIHALAA